MNQRQFIVCLIGLFAWALVLIALGRHTGIDLRLSNWMYDENLAEFPWRDTWFASVFMHKWMKYLFILVGMCAAAVLLASRYIPAMARSSDQKRRLAVVVLSFLSVPLIISLMKSQSIHHCPWDLERYGGFAPYLRLFDSLPEGIKPGHCFPAGHASSALWLPAFAAFWLPHQPRRALFIFVMGLLPGLLLGWVQQMRGAHFLSHTLWSAWIAGLIILILSRLLIARRT
ncbi:MAG: phosphatase PAP2 family protein [Burkholderiaceae bacterium]